MTTGHRPRSNKKESLSLVPPPRHSLTPGLGGAPGGLQGPRAPASPTPTPRASARLPAVRRTLRRSRLPRKTSSLAARNFNTGRKENKYINTDAQICCWGSHLDFGILRRSWRQEIVHF
ncbi:hypothetical protein AB1E18_007349 [Capra hircus]